MRTFFIHQILLFPKNADKVVRTLNFEKQKINIVTGTSGRGKSALTHIIDYCLGSSRCLIPVGPIRNKVAWYGLFIELDGRLMFLARREPGEDQQSEDYCLSEGPTIAIPISPSKNTNRDSIKARFNELLGLPMLDLAGGAPTGKYDARPSFRDLATFNFLPQHIVANPQTLFFKTDTTAYRERLRKLFPFALGVVTTDYLLAEHESQVLSKRIEDLSAELATRRKSVNTWKSDLKGYVSTARELGLLPPSADLPDSTGVLIELLRMILTNPANLRAVSPTGENTIAAVARFNALNRREEEITRGIGNLRRELTKVTQLRSAVQTYTSELSMQSGRLQPTKWFAEKLRNNHACPLCGTTNDEAAHQIEGLISATAKLNEEISAVGRSPISLERQQTNLGPAIQNLEIQLRSIRRERIQLEDASNEAAESRQRLESVYRFVGRVEQAIRGVEESNTDAELARELDRLQAEVKVVRSRFDSKRRFDQEKVLLRTISERIRHYAVILKLERSGDVIDLVPAQLAMTFTSNTGHADYLWELGSGENWMGYHIALLLALHEQFLTLSSSSVLSFLVIDQPTQVYFPARRDVYEKAKQDDDKNPDSDIASARRIFETLSNAIERTNGSLQIIVTEHADALTWGEVPHMHPVENFRDQNFLIPLDW